MLAANTLFARLRSAPLVTRGTALLKGIWPYAVAVLLPGGSLIALGMWLYSRHKAGKPFSSLFILSSRPAIEGFFKLRSEASDRP